MKEEANADTIARYVDPLFMNTLQTKHNVERITACHVDCHIVQKSGDKGGSLRPVSGTAGDLVAFQWWEGYCGYCGVLIERDITIEIAEVR